VRSRLSFRGLAAGQCFARLGELFLAAVTWLENDLFGLGVDLEHARKRERHLAADQKHQRPVRLYLDEVRTDVAEAERAITGGRSDSDVDGIQLVWWLQLIGGIVELALGFWAAGYYGRSAVLLVAWVAAFAIIRGVRDIVAAFRVRELQHPSAA
jgi:hypothetical protein